jgi:hypothetical protein
MTLRLLRPELAANAYAREIDTTLPRVLALADRDPLSPTCGYGDRQFWAWKLIDFANGTLQGAVNGLSALLAADAFAPHVSQADMEGRIDTMLAATVRMMRRDGSFEEALPLEQSYCVTALVLYDALCAVARTPAPARAARAAAIRPLERAVGFLIRRDETHGFISNHLATAAAALLRWDALFADETARRKGGRLLERILGAQSEEGWFNEYGGADPGYQTLCITHLADAAALAADDRLQAALDRAMTFLSHFVHPDGSFGGIYGSRATRIYYPAGVEMLARRSAMAEALAARMRMSVARAATVPLTAIDQPNLLPLFNNYCQALLVAPGADPAVESGWSPLWTGGRRWFREAGLLIDCGESHYTVISVRKGGVVYHWRNGRLAVCDTGIALDDGRGRTLTSQGDDRENRVELANDRVKVSGRLRRRAIPLPGPWNFLLLRCMALTVMRIPPIGALVKRLIARFLVGGRRTSQGTFTREIALGPDLHIADRWQPAGLRRIEVTTPFSVIHMASAGYWQIGDSAAADAPLQRSRS